MANNQTILFSNLDIFVKKYLQGSHKNVNNYKPSEFLIESRLNSNHYLLASSMPCSGFIGCNKHNITF